MAYHYCCIVGRNTKLMVLTQLYFTKIYHVYPSIYIYYLLESSYPLNLIPKVYLIAK